MNEIPNGVRYQVESHAKRLDRIEEDIRHIGVLQEREVALARGLENLEKRFTTENNKLYDKMDNMQKALYTAAFGITGSAVLFAVTIFAVFQ
jgi:hypothetical protein